MSEQRQFIAEDIEVWVGDRAVKVDVLVREFPDGTRNTVVRQSRSEDLRSRWSIPDTTMDEEMPDGSRVSTAQPPAQVLAHEELRVIRDQWGGCRSCFEGKHGLLKDGVCACCGRKVPE